MRSFIIILTICSCPILIRAQSVRLEKHSTNSGGEISTSNSFKLSSSVGISAVGLPRSANYLVAGGFHSFQSQASTVADNSAPSINYTLPLPETFTKDGQAINVSVIASDNDSIQKVEFYHKKLRSVTYQVREAFIEKGAVWSAELTGQMLDELGVEFFFVAFDFSGNVDSTGIKKIFLVYNKENSPSIPSGNLGVGGKAEDWRMFSIPYELKNNSVSALFSELGEPKVTKWRLVHYMNDETRFVEYPDQFSFISRNKGYWINSKINFDVKLGATDPPGNIPVQLQLNKGWNQIGNPYPFTINWTSVKESNMVTASIEGLRVFKGGTSLIETNFLSAFEAAYVNSGESVTLNIPYDNSISSRMKDNTSRRNPIDNEDWEVIFNIKSGAFENNIGGVGMRHDASPGRDAYDYMRVPRFVRFVDISFSHPEDYNLYFTRDIVPVAEYYVWDMEIETNVQNEFVEISWDNSYFGNGNKKLVLFDPNEQKIIDMSLQDNYKFPGRKRFFKIFYGSLEVMEGIIRPATVYLGKPFPNPFSSGALIPFTLPETEGNFDVRLEIVDILGNTINVLTDRSFESGFHRIEWNGTGSPGENVDSGLYIIVMKVTSEHTNTILSQKILKR